MTKKKINIILIVVVLSLWGTVGYITINRYFGNNGKIINTEVQNQEISLKQINKDTFELKKITRDPFLNKHFSDKPVLTDTYHTPIKKVLKPFTSVPKVKPTIIWPLLHYFGYIKSNNQELVLLKIDSKLHKLKLNEEINGLKINKKFKDSIEVSLNFQNRIVRLKK
jgi:hypothetical protein